MEGANMSYVRKVSWVIMVSFLIVMLSGAFIHVNAATEVKTIWWKAKTTKKLKVKDVKTKKKFKIGKGKTLVVTKRNYRHLNPNAKSTCVYKDHEVRIPNKYLNFKKDLCTGAKGDYDDDTKEYFVNVARRAQLSKKGRGNRLIWVSLDKQRVNVFIGSPGKWELEKVFLTSTGAAKTPTPVGPDVVNFKKLEYKIEGSRVKYFVEAVGSGFHKWSYSGKFRARAGKHTISHGCIRLKESDAIWMYKNIEEGTRVLIY